MRTSVIKPIWKKVSQQFYEFKSLCILFTIFAYAFNGHFPVGIPTKAREKNDKRVREMHFAEGAQYM